MLLSDAYSSRTVISRCQKTLAGCWALTPIHHTLTVRVCCTPALVSSGRLAGPGTLVRCSRQSPCASARSSPLLLRNGQYTRCGNPSLQLRQAH